MSDRVVSNTPRSLNEQIVRQTDRNVAGYTNKDQDAIDCRLEQLDQEWDVERFLETVAPSLTLAGFALGLRNDKRWFALPVLVQSFLLLHGVQGWCPPLPFLRMLGVRTLNEINQERTALKLLRGDFRSVANPMSGPLTESVMKAVRS